MAKMNLKKVIALIEGLAIKYEIPYEEIPHLHLPDGKHPAKAYKFGDVVLLVFEDSENEWKIWMEIYKPYSPETIALILKRQKSVSDEIKMKEVIKKSKKMPALSVGDVVKGILWVLTWGFFSKESDVCLPGDETFSSTLPDLFIKKLKFQPLDEERYYITKGGKFVKKEEFRIGARMFKHFWDTEL